MDLVTGLEAEILQLIYGNIDLLKKLVYSLARWILNQEMNGMLFAKEEFLKKAFYRKIYPANQIELIMRKAGKELVTGLGKNVF